MEQGRAKRVRDIFDEVMDAPIQDRPALLERLCGGDRELLNDVASLVRSAEDAASFMDSGASSGEGDEEATAEIGVGTSGNVGTGPSSGGTGGSSRPSSGGSRGGRPRTRPSRGEPDQIGPYRIVTTLGRGGMGSVYAAVREDDPLQKTIALKVIRRGVDTEDILKRFELERRVLSSLDHPNIAKFFGAGETEDGRPYFVMEYIQGVPIDKYCDDNNLSILKRLELFQKLCAAVQHAHENLIVHRDLKPGNVLVNTKGEPKLVDFGISKLVNPQMAAVEAITGPGLRLMTPEYASPEQVRGGSVTTRADVYSLGVVLYELLTGRRPYKLTARIQEELVRVICESDPERPSTSITREDQEIVKPEPGGRSRRSQTVEEVARHRSTRPDTLRRMILGDLDDIVLMAMQKSPDARYESPSDMAADIGRHLKQEPVTARRARRRILYVARKAVRRHPRLITGVSVGTIVLAIGLTYGLWQREQRIRTELELETQQLLAEAELKAAEEKRQVELETAQVFQNVVWRNIAGSATEVELSVKSRDALWSTVQRQFEELRKKHGDDSEIVWSQMAHALLEVGDVELGVRTKGKGEPGEALKRYEEGRDLARRLVNAKPEQAESRRLLARAEYKLGTALRELLRSDEASDAFERTAELMRGRDGVENRRLLAFALRARGQMHGRACELERGIALLEESISIRESLLQLEPSNPVYIEDIASIRVNLANQFRKAGSLEEAIGLYRNALATRVSLARNDASVRRRRNLANSRLLLADALTEAGDLDSAITQATLGIESSALVMVEDPEDSQAKRDQVFGREILAEALFESGRFEEAAGVATVAMDRVAWQEQHSPGYTQNPRLRSLTLYQLARAQRAAGGSAADAIARLEEAREEVEGMLALDTGREVLERLRIRIELELARALLDNDADAAARMLERARAHADAFQGPCSGQLPERDRSLLEGGFEASP